MLVCGSIMRSIALPGEFIIVIGLTRVARARGPGLSAAPAPDVFILPAGPACAFSSVETSVRDRAAPLSSSLDAGQSSTGRFRGAKSALHQFGSNSRNSCEPVFFAVTNSKIGRAHV